MGGGRVDFGEEEAGLTAVLVAVDVARHREAIPDDHVGIVDGPLEEVLKVLVLGLFLVVLLAPLGDGVAVPHDNVEKGVQQEDAVRGDGGNVEQDGHGRPAERVAQQARLDHGQTVGHRLLEKVTPEEGRLVWRRVEHVKELRPPQVEHKLRVDGELFGEAERGGVVLAVVAELGDKADEVAVEPAQHVDGLLRVRLAHSVPSHEDSSCLLVEALGNLEELLWLRPVLRNRGDAQARLAAGVLVARDKLEVSKLALWDGLVVLVGDFEEDSHRRLRVQTAHLPRAGTPLPNLRLADAGRLFVERGNAADATGHLEVLG
mmetsp:Transcript_41917/g.98451  ORF Transcript_41917/g.98451 Transcript_41917/m.98451 type:complete len:318 (-) Transcript_41917:1255-2208(-)